MSKKSHFRQNVFLGFFAFFLAGRAVIAGELLPTIDARRFESKVIQRSTTGRIYLFNTEQSKLPVTGAVLLAHEQDRPVLAFKVIRTDPSRSEFIAKRIRRYDQTSELEINRNYLMMEKVADVISPPSTGAPVAGLAQAPQQSPQEAPVTSAAETTLIPQASGETTNPQQRLNVENFDSELDSSSSPNTQGWEDSDYYPNEVEEKQILNPFESAVGVMIGVYRNLSDFTTSGASYGGFSVNYSRLLGRDIFLFSKAPQDAIHLEFGAGYYNVQNQEPINDSYTVVPLIAQLRYDIQFSYSFALFMYGGLEYNLVAGNSDGVQETLDTLVGIQPTVGIGMLYTLGPHWFFRVDIGWDKMAAGLTLEW